jgi:hypothetical protein
MNVHILCVNYVDPQGIIRHKADQKNNDKSHHDLCNIAACVHLRILPPLRYITRPFHKMAGGQDVSEGNHTERKFTGHQELEYYHVFVMPFKFATPTVETEML